MSAAQLKPAAAKAAAVRVGSSAGPTDPEQNFRFYDNRQKYLMFVNTCSEKWVVAHRVAEELKAIHPRPPAMRLFDAGVGDGTVLTRVMRTMHSRFDKVPFYIVGKEISLEDVRLTLEKMPDRFFEHPATVLVITNMNYAEAPWLSPANLNAAATMVWREVPLHGNSAAEFDEQIADLQPFLTDAWRAGVNPKTGNPVYEKPAVLVLYREDCRFLLDSIIPRRGAVRADYDLVIASQPYRARASTQFKAKRVIAPLARSLAPGGRLLGIHSHGDDPALEIVQTVWPGEEPFHTNRHELLAATKAELGKAGAQLQLHRRLRLQVDLPLRHAHPAGRDRLRGRLYRHLHPVRRLERRGLCRPDRGSAAGGRHARRRLSEGHPRGLAEAWRAVVQRRLLRNIPKTRVDLSDDGASCDGRSAGGVVRPADELHRRGDRARP